MGFLLEPAQKRKEAFPRQTAGSDGTAWVMPSPYTLIEEISKEAKEQKKRKIVFRNALEEELSKLFGIEADEVSAEILLDKARHVFDDFRTFNSLKLGREKSKEIFFLLCQNIPTAARKKLLSVVEPRQFALILSGFYLGNDKYLEITEDGIDNSAARKECLSLFMSNDDFNTSLAKTVDDVLAVYLEMTSPVIDSAIAAKMFIRFVEYIPKQERQKILFSMTPQEFAEMLVGFIARE